MSDLSSKLDLLECLRANDETLTFAAVQVGDPDRARHIVRTFLQHDLATLHSGNSRVERWEHDSVLEDPANWDRSSNIILRCTPKGADQFETNSEEFFRKLFGS